MLCTHLYKSLPVGELSKQTYLYFSVHPSSTSLNSTNDRLGNKTDSMVSLLGCKDIDKMSMQFLGMSATPSSCDLMRQHRVVPFLVKILHFQKVFSLRFIQQWLCSQSDSALTRRVRPSCSVITFLMMKCKNNSWGKLSFKLLNLNALYDKYF